VALESAQYDFAEAVPNNTFKRVSRLALIGAAPAAFTSFLFPLASLNAAARLLPPWTDVPRFTLVQIGGLPAEMLVPHGEEFNVRGNVAYRSFWMPGRASAWFGRLRSGETNVN